MLETIFWGDLTAVANPDAVLDTTLIIVLNSDIVVVDTTLLLIETFLDTAPKPDAVTNKFNIFIKDSVNALIAVDVPSIVFLSNFTIEVEFDNVPVIGFNACFIRDVTLEAVADIGFDTLFIRVVVLDDVTANGFNACFKRDTVLDEEATKDLTALFKTNANVIAVANLYAAILFCNDGEVVEDTTRDCV